MGIANVVERAHVLICWVPWTFSTSIHQHSESSEVSHDNSMVIFLRSESAASAAKRPPRKRRTSGASRGSRGCVIGLPLKKPLGKPSGLVPTWSKVVQDEDKTLVETAHYDLAQFITSSYEVIVTAS